ncbi:MAG TPA: ubiquitin-like small modifier protein 1 [Anaerolineales bacterium]|nr:ubiquitin-like small modifier protein 1 [Anaerolineales bacterium]
MKVNFYSTLRMVVGEKTVEVALEAGGTVSQLVAVMIQSYPALKREILDDSGRLYRHINVIVNGRSAPFLENGMDTVLRQEDTVSIFPAVGGG